MAELERASRGGDAQALVLCDEGDIVNFHLALAAREAQPDLRLVVRLFNLELGEQAERLLGCRALSASQLAAPAFVEAALRDDYAQRLTVEDHELLVLPGRRRRRHCSRSTRPTRCCRTSCAARSA